MKMQGIKELFQEIKSNEYFRKQAEIDRRGREFVHKNIKENVCYKFVYIKSFYFQKKCRNVGRGW